MLVRDNPIARCVEGYTQKRVSRKEFIKQLARITGSSTAAFAFLSSLEIYPATAKNLNASNMTTKRKFHQVDVFSNTPLLGNALAVVHDATGMADNGMAAFARWTNLSETTFLFPPINAEADYKVRIFTTDGELPFAGHPTLGSCFAWLAAGGKPKSSAYIVQECGVGLVKVRRDGSRLAFAAPPLRRTGPVDEVTLTKLAGGLGLRRDDFILHQWIDNGPGWFGVMLKSAEQVIALRPDYSQLKGLAFGVIGPQPAGNETDFEVRGFYVAAQGSPEDPVTGSLNAGLGQWLIGAGKAKDHYVVSQGTALQRKGRVYIDRIGKDIWVGGDVVICVEGSVSV